MDILIEEIPGRKFMCRLMIEQQGAQYQMAQTDAGSHPVLPVFKTTAVDEKLIPQMHIYPDQETLDGPVFGASTANK